MTKTFMPEPAAYRTRYPSEPGMIGHYPWHYTDYEPKRLAFNPEMELLITTTQAEAYAQACVKEALEEAAQVPRTYAEELDQGLFGKRYPEQVTAIFNASTNMADRIRALIKSTPA